MTPTPSTPNLTQDLIRIHKVITRGINIGISKGTEYLQSGLPQPQILLGYTNYVRCLTSVLSAHHRAEDQVAFPALEIKLPSVPYDLLIANHHEIELLLIVINKAITDLSGNAPEDGLKAFVDNMQKVSSIWVMHIFWEEQHFSGDKLAAVMDSNEQMQLSEAMSKFSQEHTNPPYWIVPFMLFNLEPKDRITMAASFPPMVVNELVPKAWVDEWAPMKPFLLE